MTDRTELLEAALESFPEGIALLELDGRVQLWNRAAETITGYAGVDVLGRPLPAGLEPLPLCAFRVGETAPGRKPRSGCGPLIHARHKLGHDVSALARTFVLRDGLGARIGAAVFFHPAEHMDGLLHGEACDSSDVGASQAELEDRLGTMYEDFARGDAPFGVLWITVDQAHGLRRTHGASACEAMLEQVERTLANGLRTGEELGRWGDDEFLVLSHERSAALLAAHAQGLAGLARTAEFRWWGDRVSLTVSIGAAHTDHGELPEHLLDRAQSAMISSIHAGGNHATLAPGRQPCSPY